MTVNFRNEQVLVQAKNTDLNESYWSNGLYKSNVDKEKVLMVFDTMAQYRIYKRNMDKRIKFEMNRYGYTSKKELINSILGNKFYRNTFTINPIRQNSYGKVQGRQLEQVISHLRMELGSDYVVAFKKNSTNYDYVITENGDVLSNVNRKHNGTCESKAFNYVITIEKDFKFYNIYVSCRCTNNNGGAQNDTLREVNQTWTYCGKSKNERNYFLFLLDGDYWTTAVKLLKRKKRDNCIIANTHTVEETLRNFIEQTIK